LANRFSIIIVNTNEGAVLFECLERIFQSCTPFETIVVDNASTDGSPERVESDHPEVVLVRARTNMGYAGANDLGARHANGDVLIFLNPDAFVQPGWLEAIAPRFDDATVAAVGPRIYRGRARADELLDSAGGDIEFPVGDAPGRGYLRKFDAAYAWPADVAYLSGAALAVRADVFRRLGGFDEDFFCYYEETDLCWRIRMIGLRCVYEPDSIVRHLGSFTFGPASARKIHLQTRNRIRSCLQNLDSLNVLRFIGSEVVVGLCIIAACVTIGRHRAYAGAYLRAWYDVAAGLPAVLRKRSERQRSRAVSDGVVLALHRRVSIAAVLRRYAVFARYGGDAVFAEGIGAVAPAE